MSEASVEVNTKDVELLFQNAPRALKRELANALDHISRKFLKKFYSERLSGAPGLDAKRGGIFHRFRRVVITSKTDKNGDKSSSAKFLDIHASQRSTTSAISNAAKSPLDMRVEIYTKSKVASKYEEGGRVSAKSGMMRIPLSPEAKQRGDKNPILNLSPVQTAKGLFLVQKLGKHKMIFHYILKHSVPVNRRLGFMSTWESMNADKISILNDAITTAFAKA